MNYRVFVRARGDSASRSFEVPLDPKLVADFTSMLQEAISRAYCDDSAAVASRTSSFSRLSVGSMSALAAVDVEDSLRRRQRSIASVDLARVVVSFLPVVSRSVESSAAASSSMSGAAAASGSNAVANASPGPSEPPLALAELELGNDDSVERMEEAWRQSRARSAGADSNDDRTASFAGHPEGMISPGAASTPMSAMRAAGEPARFIIDPAHWGRELDIVRFADLKIEQEIGRGAFGRVFKARLGHKECCVKLFSAELSESAMQSFVEEARVLGSLHNPHTVLFMGVCLDPGQCCVLTEYMEGGDLGHFLATRAASPLPLRVRVRILFEAGVGLEYLHSKGLAHRDVKPSNILLEGRMFPVKIADFGLSGHKKSSLVGGGTARYAAPEVLMGAAADLRADVFSFGVVMFEVLSGNRAADRAFNSLASPGTLDESVVPGALRALVTACCLAEPAARPSMSQVCERLVAVHDSIWCDPTPIGRLPPAMLRAVLSWLEPAQRAAARAVCHSWRRAAAEPMLWRDVVANDHVLTASDKSVRLCLAAPYLGLGAAMEAREALQLHGCGDVGLTLLGPHLGALRSLNVSHAGLSDAGFAAISGVCGNLTALDASHCRALSDAAAHTIGQTCHALKTLVLDGLSRLSDEGMRHLVAGCPDLVRVSLVGCTSLGDVSLRYLASCVHLASVNLSDCVQVTDEGVEPLVTSCSLRSITLANCANLTDKSVRELLAFSSQLRRLVLSGCRRLTGEAYPAWPAQLEYLALGACVRLRAGACGPSKLPSSLAFINLSDVKSLGVVGLGYAAASCPNLRTAMLGNTDATDEVLALLAANCPNLSRLDLSNCRDVSDRGLGALGGSARQLESLVLVGCDRITDSGVRFVSKGCRGLRHFDLSGCKRLTNTACLYLDALPALEAVAVAWCPLLTNLGVQALCARPALVTLSLERCPLIDDDGVATIARLGTRLTSLNLSDLPLLTDASLACLVVLRGSLVSLAVDRAPKLTPDGLLALVRECTLMRSLSVRACKLISNDDVAGLLAARTGLRVVSA